MGDRLPFTTQVGGNTILLGEAEMDANGNGTATIMVGATGFEEGITIEFNAG